MPGPPRNIAKPRLKLWLGGQFPGLAFMKSENLKAERMDSPTPFTPTRRGMKPRTVRELARGHTAETRITVFFPLGNLNVVIHPTVDWGGGPVENSNPG